MNADYNRVQRHLFRHQKATVISLTIEGNANLAPVLGFEVVTIGLDCGTVSNKKRVADNPRFPGAVTLRALAAVTSTPGSKQSGAVTQDRATPRLVECDPELYFGAEGFETHPGIILKILDELVLVQHAAISFMQIIWQIPVEEGYERLDARCTEIVNKLDIVLDALFVYGVVAATEWNDARPRQREAVGLGASLLQEGNVLICAVVGVASDITRISTSNLAWNATKSVPDGVCAAVVMRRALDLVTTGSTLSLGTGHRLGRRCGGVHCVENLGGGWTNLAVANPHRKSLGRYDWDMMGL